MPWKESRIVDERIKFIADILRGDHNMTELCQIYNISRKTGYKWIERFQESGASGLEELDRRPQNCPHATPDRIVKQILELRFKHPTWGARKLRARLEETKNGTEWPATSTITAILHRSGLLHTAKRKRKVTPSEFASGRHYGPESGLVHGLQRILPLREQTTLRSFHNH
jgi:transposase